MGLGSLTSPPIGEALAGGTLDGPFGAGGVVHAEGGAVAIAKPKFGQVALQVLFAAVLAGAAQAALEDREEAFDHVHGDEAVGVLAALVVDGEVLGELLAEADVMRRLIGHVRGFAIGIAEVDRTDFMRLETVGLDRADKAVTPYQRHYLSLGA